MTRAAPTLAIKAANPAESTVLYIEDDVANVQLVERLLMQRPNINVMTSLLGSVGIELAQEYRPDLILLDVHLTDLHGFEVLERLQGDSRTVDIPVVVLSADATTWQRRRFRNAGVYDYLSKPLEPATVARRHRPARRRPGRVPGARQRPGSHHHVVTRVGLLTARFASESP